jgi:xanthine dehydrogenase small subunit
MLDHVLLYVNGRRHEVRGPAAFLSLSDYLRRAQGLTGTKIVCSEGDCGACSVLIGRDDGGPGGRDSFATWAHDGTAKRPVAKEYRPRSDGLTYRPIDACIQFMWQLDGVHVVTIEGLSCSRVSPKLGDASFGETGLQPSAVQRAMIDCHGSQCGFCTPGFVVAMTGLLEERVELDECALRHGLTGNLCRCTGYTPIIEAGVELGAARHQRIEERFPSRSMRKEFAARRGQRIEVRTEWDGEMHVFASPPDLEGALAFLAAHPSATIVAGATDIGVRINKSLSVPRTILDLNRVAELEGVAVENGEIVLGARASWTAIEELCKELVPEFYTIAAVFGAPQIRHVGTIGGNIANASPIADSLPFLFVMDAVLELASSNGARNVPITEFYQGYKKFDLRAGELIRRVRVPLPKDDEILKLYKVSRRRDLDIATFTAGVRLRLDGETIADAAVAFGAVGPVVIRARQTEAFLRGRTIDEETMRQAGDVAVSEITPISDVRGGAGYRYQLTRNVLLKFYHEMQAMAETV